MVTSQTSFPLIMTLFPFKINCIISSEKFQVILPKVRNHRAPKSILQPSNGNKNKSVFISWFCLEISTSELFPEHVSLVFFNQQPLLQTFHTCQLRKLISWQFLNPRNYRYFPNQSSLQIYNRMTFNKSSDSHSLRGGITS